MKSMEGCVTVIANALSIAVMAFGMSQETADVINKAAPTIIGGVMSLVTVVTYLVNKRKEKIEVFKAIASQHDVGTVSAQNAENKLIATAKNLGMI